MIVVLPFPPSILSGHAKGNGQWAKIAATKEYRALACDEANKGGIPSLPETGDIRIHFSFIPPDRRGDRVNFPNRLKPYIDGIADALGVNDSRFLPSYSFFDPAKPGKVIIEVRL